VEEDDIWGTHRVERTYGKVSRTLTLPVNADAEHAECKFENGVLKVIFPKLSAGSSVGAKKLFIT